VSGQTEGDSPGANEVKWGTTLLLLYLPEAWLSRIL
jgi:hypothetical protein